MVLGALILSSTGPDPFFGCIFEICSQFQVQNIIKCVLKHEKIFFEFAILSFMTHYLFRFSTRFAGTTRLMYNRYR